MAYVTRTVHVGDNWTFLTDNIALLQFNDEMYMYLGDSSMPTEKVGMVMDKNEKYINNEAGVYVYAKSRYGGSNIESVRISENIL